MTKCILTFIKVEGHEKSAENEMYERNADVKITTRVQHEVLRPEFFKELIKVYIIVIYLITNYSPCLNLLLFKIIILILLEFTHQFVPIFCIQKGSTVLQPMIVEKVSPVVVHLVPTYGPMPPLSFAPESNVKVTFDEKTEPIAAAHHVFLR